jgi:hypothetical protein
MLSHMDHNINIGDKPTTQAEPHQRHDQSWELLPPPGSFPQDETSNSSLETAGTTQDTIFVGQAESDNQGIGFSEG